MLPKSGSGLLQIGINRKNDNGVSICLVSLVKFSYLSKFHVNIITGSEIMNIFVYKGMNRNPEIGNTFVWVLPNIWRLGRVRNTKFGVNVSNDKLLNAANYQGYSFYYFWVIKEKPKGAVKINPTRLGLNPVTILSKDYGETCDSKFPWLEQLFLWMLYLTGIKFRGNKNLRFCE